MNKLLKVLNTVLSPLKFLYQLLDKYVVYPLSKLIYTTYKRINITPNFLDKYLNKQNTLLYLSLVLSLFMFFVIDNKTTKLIENEAEILDNQPVTIIYNEEAFVVDGAPKTVDITLIGRRSDLYLAKQLGNHKVTLDLSGYSEGQHKVKLKYNHSVETVKYKLDPSTLTITISPKVSSVKTLTYDLFNQDKLDPKLSIGEIKLESGEVIVKSSEKTLSKVASVKALVDVSNEKLTSAGKYKIDDIPLVAYDESGKIINNVEMVPAKVNAEVVVTSNSIEVPIKVIPQGEETVGYAISDITSSVSKVTLYGEQSVLENIKYIEAIIDIDNLSQNKTYSVTLSKPNGIRHMSASTTTVEVSVQAESSIEFVVKPINNRNLDTEKFTASVTSVDDTSVTVIVKGVKSVLNSINEDTITAYADLSGLGVGSHNAPIIVESSDVRLKLTPKVKTVSIVIRKK